MSHISKLNEDTCWKNVIFFLLCRRLLHYVHILHSILHFYFITVIFQWRNAKDTAKTLNYGMKRWSNRYAHLNSIKIFVLMSLNLFSFNSDTFRDLFSLLKSKLGGKEKKKLVYNWRLQSKSSVVYQNFSVADTIYFADLKTLAFSIQNFKNWSLVLL